jgi:hypothetical protein
LDRRIVLQCTKEINARETRRDLKKKRQLKEESEVEGRSRRAKRAELLVKVEYIASTVRKTH